MIAQIRSGRMLLPVALCLLLLGCGWFGPERTAVDARYADMSDEEQLRVRAQERADALVKRDMVAVYQFATPSYRATFDQRHLANQYGGQVRRTRAEVESVEIASTGTDALVLVSLWAMVDGFTGSAPFELSTTSRQTWAKRDGLWWFVEPR